MLLTLDSDAYKESFFKDTASLHICWECAAVINRMKRFQLQACAVQKQLTAISDGQEIKLKSLSRLTTTNATKPNQEYQHNDTESFIDCSYIKEITDIKLESDDDMPISSFYSKNNLDDRADDNDDFHTGKDEEVENSVKVNFEDNNIVQKRFKTERDVVIPQVKLRYHKYFAIELMYEEEMQNYMNSKRKSLSESDAPWKCQTCLLVFKSLTQRGHHDRKYHKEKENTVQCDICQSYVEDLQTHKQTHYYMYKCLFCEHNELEYSDILKHLKLSHNIMRTKSDGEKIAKVKMRAIIKRDNYPCPECDEMFRHKDMRWRHIQKKHRDGFQCDICHKKFSLKSQIERHLRAHEGTLPRVQCETCHKVVLKDVLRTHMRTHAHRESHTCLECDKTFVCRATYEDHLKYSKAHSFGDNLKYKCPSCHKGYRTNCELNDHINYHHNGQAEHKCSICGKGLATKRCLRRHIRRAHEGIKENTRTTICQMCGKNFTNKKSLYEHELIHSGVRPLACAICGRTFRQRAALYTHNRRVHKET